MCARASMASPTWPVSSRGSMPPWSPVRSATCFETDDGLFRRRRRSGRGSAGGLDGLDLEHHAVVEPDRGEGFAPDAAGIEADVVRADVEAEGRPVAEDDGVADPRGSLEREPRDAAGGRVGGA